MKEKTVKLTLTSDVHLEFNGAKLLLDNDANVLLIAGDILTARNLDKSDDSPMKQKYVSALAEWSKRYDDVYYIAGNHEHYGYNIDLSHNVIRETIAQFSNIHYMDGDHAHLNDEYVLLGTTLWADANRGNPLVEYELENSMNDFRIIRYGDDYRRFTPKQMRLLHEKYLFWLREAVQDLAVFDKKVIVMSHHAPSYESIATSFRHSAGMAMNYGYFSDLDEFILQNQRIKYWLHGHTHASSDYMIGNTRVLANPQGYPMERNPDFNPKFVLEI